MNKKPIAYLSIVALSILLPSIAVNAAVKPGGACKKAGSTTISSGKKYTCLKSGKRLVWSKGVAIAVTTRITAATTTTLAMPVQTQVPENGLVVPAPKAYPKIVGALNAASATATTSFELPIAVQPAPSGTNLKLWIYSPSNTKVKAGSPGIFMSKDGGDWKFYAANSDGSFYATVSAGAYGIDVVEPDTTYLRKRYMATVSTQGVFSITGQSVNSSGYFTVTIDLQPVLNPVVEELKTKLTAAASVPASSFKPTSACQLIDQVTPNRSLSVALTAGFPKVPIRLKSVGHIKALIVPVDFTDIIGRDNPLTYFGNIANGVSTFYLKQSYGQLAFDFDVIPNWIHVPFTSTKFGTGGTVGSGDPDGYLQALINLTDGPIDYSSYEAVYFLVPKEMPMANMGWGPAIASPHWISNGVILSGATGGADMYYNENNGVKGATWKWMAHETGHAFGLYDEDLDHVSQTLGNWGVMAASWSNDAIELGAWDRYLQGWLPQSQINCVEMSALTTEGTTTKISPIVRQDQKIKSVMVPITSSKILVIESRKNESLDRLSADREGVLVYTVDMTKGQLGGGYKVQKRIGTTDQEYFKDAALHAGDSITVGQVKITVIGLDASGDTVIISKP